MGRRRDHRAFRRVEPACPPDRVATQRRVLPYGPRPTLCQPRLKYLIYIRPGDAVSLTIPKPAAAADNQPTPNSARAIMPVDSRPVRVRWIREFTRPARPGSAMDTRIHTAGSRGGRNDSFRGHDIWWLADDRAARRTGGLPRLGRLDAARRLVPRVKRRRPARSTAAGAAIAAGPNVVT